MNIRGNFILFLASISETYDFINTKRTTLSFQHEKINYLFKSYDNEDPSYFRIYIPIIGEVDSDPKDLQELIDLATSYKTGKVNIDRKNNIWLVSESFVYSEENIYSLFQRVINMLKDMLLEYRKSKKDKAENAKVYKKNSKKFMTGVELNKKISNLGYMLMPVPSRKDYYHLYDKDSKFFCDLTVQNGYFLSDREAYDTIEDFINSRKFIIKDRVLPPFCYCEYFSPAVRVDKAIYYLLKDLKFERQDLFKVTTYFNKELKVIISYTVEEDSLAGEIVYKIGNNENIAIKFKDLVSLYNSMILIIDSIYNNFDKTFNYYITTLKRRFSNDINYFIDKLIDNLENLKTNGTVSETIDN